ncbi:MAG: redoxin domain-containing protein [Bacteroidota bacterium]
MKRKAPFFVLASLIFALCVRAQENQVATVSPARPKIGDEIAVTYNPKARAATLREAKEISLEALVMREMDLPTLIETPMRKEGKIWRASFKLTDVKARLILLRFVSDDRKDDNGENVWDILVHGTDGKPLKGAHLQRASFLRQGSFLEFKHQKDIAAAKTEVAKERELYPDNWQATTLLWNIMLRENPSDETKAKIKEELAKLYESQKDDEEVVSSLLYWFEQTGQKDKADEIRKAAIAANPKGKIAESARRSEIYAEKDAAKKVELLEKFLVDFPQKGTSLENYQRQLAYFCIQAGQYDKADSILESMPKPDGMMYNEIAWPLIEKGEQLEKAVAWAKKGADLLRNPSPASKPSYYSNKQWKRSQENSLGYILDTYAFGLFKLGRTQEAEKAYEEAYVLTKGGEPEINERLVECYVKNGRFEKAMEVCSDRIRNGKSTDKMIEYYKAAYVKVKGSDKGFDDALNEAKNFAKNETKKKLLKQRINKPAIDFYLKGLDGKYVKLSDLKDKVVVLDFWATWCGPCKASLPYLQKVYNQYKNNNRVVILALNTWERQTGAEREALVKKFVEENKYTFPVLLDENFVEKYGVEGIPTKFVIDRKGKIQFKGVGFSGGQEMMDELTLEIDMLLSDDFYSSYR